MQAKKWGLWGSESWGSALTPFSPLNIGGQAAHIMFCLSGENKKF
jgi:hypothetical protein